MKAQRREDIKKLPREERAAAKEKLREDVAAQKERIAEAKAECFAARDGA